MKNDISRLNPMIFWRADNYKPFGLLLKSFFIFVNYFSEKEGFLISYLLYKKNKRNFIY